ncbi:exosome-associated family protein [Gigaspora margarita]|uniref:Exosome complex protein n=1 Tax=Gigaspora margarita TaxID=4874 RepID=A0A8H3WYR0_GIGMA|nr:exosome-associated family protein [Gigaspora margarita]
MSSSSNNNGQQNWAEGSGNSVLLSGVKENNFISELEADFSRIETVFDTLLAQPLSELASRFPPTERARLYLLYAYCCNKLTSLYLEVNGEPEAKEVLEQEKRVQESSNRVENTINPPQPSLTIDRSAAARFIMHSLPKEREARDEVRATSSTHTRFDDYSERRFSSSSPNDKRASGFHSINSSPSDRRASGGFYNTSSPSSDRRSSNNYNIGSPNSERDSFRMSTSTTSSRITNYDRSDSYIRDYDRDYDRNYDRGYYDRDYNRDDRDRDRGDERPRKQKKKNREGESKRRY